MCFRAVETMREDHSFLNVLGVDAVCSVQICEGAGDSD